ncbi:MAG: alanine--tRNA ligase [Planctomycetales bacterium 4572_13]|nr:MAG: alanine--tRNA ligase [Planctomycetales bacterium 4572_13]
MLSSNEIRSAFIDFFTEKGHRFVPSWPVVPIGDETLLFTNAGMNQFKEIFLGHRTPEFGRAANSQKCIRVSGKHNDLEEVGIDTYHHTFFEMLGNWSFDDYFKAEAIEWAWQLLVDVYGIDPNRLWATVFEGDEADNCPADTEAADLWAKLTTLPKERVLFCGKKDNFWEMGAAGPCGPCSEIHIDLGAEHCDMRHIPGHKCAVNAGCARYIELWNLVFIQYNRKPDGKLEKLNASYIDTGAGLERITAVLQNKNSNYQTDLFMPIIAAVEDLAGKKFTAQLGNKTDNAFRVIADHIRTLTFAITDGVNPSNDGRGYVMRRILRRACRFGRSLDLHEPFMHKLVNVVTGYMGDAFGEIKERAEFVESVIAAEETSFGRTLDRGLEIFAGAATAATKNNRVVSGEDAFQLYDTFGFPLDLTELMAREQNLTVDSKQFEDLMQQQRTRARAAQKGTSLAAALSGVQMPVTDDAPKYETDSCEAELIGWINAKGLEVSGTLSDTEKTVALVLEKTCFYAESGGQVGDSGMIKTNTGKFAVESTEKIADCVLHRGKLMSGSLSVGDAAEATVDTNRQATMKNHTATHILQWALRSVLGDAVKQQGSLVCADYLRFDFTSPKALTKDQIKEIEDKLQSKIAAGLPVTTAVMNIDQAKELGAMALFGEKYGDEVRVLAIGASGEDDLASAFSKEFCGGTHVANTNEIGGFAVLKEESVAAGVRRITALTGPGLIEHLTARSRVVDELIETLKTPADKITARVGKLLDDNKALKKELKSGGGAAAGDAMAEATKLLDAAEKIGEVSIIVGKLPNVQVDQARAAIDSLKKKAKSAAIVFGVATDDGKVMLLAGVTDDLIKKGVKAGDIVKAIAPIVGGGGGGRPNMAQAGGKDATKLDEALAQAKAMIAKKLG